MRGDGSCPFCRTEVERTSHVLLHCQFSLRTWYAVFAWWDTVWVCPPDIESLMIWWFKNRFRKLEKFCWETILFAVRWSLCKARNDLVFHEVLPDPTLLVDMIKCRCAHWVKTSFDIKEYSVSDFMRSVKEVRCLKIVM